MSLHIVKERKVSKLNLHHRYASMDLPSQIFPLSEKTTRLSLPIPSPETSSCTNSPQAHISLHTHVRHKLLKLKLPQSTIKLLKPLHDPYPRILEQSLRSHRPDFLHEREILLSDTCDPLLDTRKVRSSQLEGVVAVEMWEEFFAEDAVDACEGWLDCEGGAACAGGDFAGDAFLDAADCEG